MIAPDRTSTSPYSNPFPPSGIGVVIHATRSGRSENPNEMAGTLAWMAGAGQVSSHWVIGRDGEKVRVIADDRQAWHARHHNATHWGIEVCQGVESDGYTPAQIMALAEVCRGYVEMGVPVAHDFNGFVGHEETPAGKRDGKSDPGNTFPWDAFMSMVEFGAKVMAGVGIHYTDGTDEELWNAPNNLGKIPDGIGVRYLDGTVETIWP